MSENPETVLVLGDTHGSLGFITKAIVKLAKPHDAAIHVVGDFGYWASYKSGQHFLRQLEEVLDRNNILLTFTDGNHEDHTSLQQVPIDDDGWRRVSDHIWHAPRGHDWYWGNTHFFALGGASSIDGPHGADWWGQARGPVKAGDRVMTRLGMQYAEEDKDLGWWDPGELITDEDVQRCLDKADDQMDIDVMFAHDCPSRIPIPSINRTYPEGKHNRKLLRKVWANLDCPDLIHGHYHVFHDTYRTKESARVIGLAHDKSQTHNYCWVTTEDKKIIVPEWDKR